MATNRFPSSYSDLKYTLPRLGIGVRPVMLVEDRKSTRLNSSHTVISYAVFCLKKKKHTSELVSHTDPVFCLLLAKEPASSPRSPPRRGCRPSPRGCPAHTNAESWSTGPTPRPP